MDIREFYDEKRKSHNRLVRDLIAGKHLNQPEFELYVDPETEEPSPRPTCVYLTSVRKREAGTVAGQTCMVEIWAPNGRDPGLAAERIADGTHRVATPEEVDKCLQRQIDQKKFHDNLDTKRELKKLQVVGADALSEIPAHLQPLVDAARANLAKTKTK
jgi:methylaspartate ammonia-lyase